MKSQHKKASSCNRNQKFISEKSNIQTVTQDTAYIIVLTVLPIIIRVSIHKCHAPAPIYVKLHFRSTSYGVANTAGRVGGMIAPQIVFLVRCCCSASWYHDTGPLNIQDPCF